MMVYSNKRMEFALLLTYLCLYSKGDNTCLSTHLQDQVRNRDIISFEHHSCFCSTNMTVCYNLNNTKALILAPCPTCWDTSCTPYCWNELMNNMSSSVSYPLSCIKCFCIDGFQSCTNLTLSYCLNYIDDKYLKVRGSMRPNKCIPCIDNGKFYLPGQQWSYEMIVCRCYNNGSKCFINSWSNGNIVFVRKTCEECVNIEKTRNVLYKNCYLNNNNFFEHGKGHYVEVNGNGGCVYCVCYAGDIQCQHFIDTTSSITCKGDKNCTELINNEDIKKGCSNPRTTICLNKMTSWTQHGCKWECMNSTQFHSITGTSWCEKLVLNNHCIACPKNKELFVEANSDLLWTCKSKQFVIWKYNLCDGSNDCADSSDEENCKKKYCSPTILPLGMAEFFPSIPLLHGAKANILCASNADMFVGGLTKGYLEIECKKSRDDDLFISVNKCSCVKRKINFELDRNLTVLLQRLQLYLILKNETFKSVRLDTNNGLKMIEFINSTTFHENETESLKTILMIFFQREIDTDCLEDRTLVSFAAKTSKLLRSYNISYEGQSINRFKGSFIGSISEIFDSYEVSSLVMQKLRRTLTSNKNSIILIQQSTTEDNLKWIGILSIVDTVLSTISILCLLLGVYLLFLHRSKHSKIKLHVHNNLMSIYAIANSLQQLPKVIPVKSNQNTCTVWVYTAYFSIFSTYLWMTVEGINILCILSFATQNKKLLILYYLLGYGAPVIILLALSGLSYESFRNSTNCLSVSSNLPMIKWPAGIILGGNLLLLLILICIFICKQRASVKLRHSSLKFRNVLRGFFVLMPLVGGTFLMGLFLDDAPISFAFAHVIVNASMGAIVFLLQVDGKVAIFNLTVAKITKFFYSVKGNPKKSLSHKTSSKSVDSY